MFPWSSKQEWFTIPGQYLVEYDIAFYSRYFTKRIENLFNVLVFFFFFYGLFDLEHLRRYVSFSTYHKPECSNAFFQSEKVERSTCIKKCKRTNASIVRTIDSRRLIANQPPCGGLWREINSGMFVCNWSLKHKILSLSCTWSGKEPQNPHFSH